MRENESKPRSTKRKPLSELQILYGLRDICFALGYFGIQPVIDKSLAIARENGVHFDEVESREYLEVFREYYDLGNCSLPPSRIPYGWQHATDHSLPMPGVYVIYYGGKVSYIGCSTKVRKRLCSHEKLKSKSRRKILIKARYFHPNSFGWLTLEAKLINRLKPEWNIVHT